MTIRKKRGHLVSVAPPVAAQHGRPLQGVAATRERPVVGDPSHRYAVAQIERALSLAMGNRSKYTTAKRRAERARAELVAEEDGLDQVKAINEALTADGGAAIRRAAQASVDARTYAVNAAVLLMQIVREHGISSTAGLSHAGSWTGWAELERMTLDAAFAVGPKGERFAELVKLAALASAQARHGSGWALHVEQQARDAKPQEWPAWTAPQPAPARRDEPDEHQGDDEGQAPPEGEEAEQEPLPSRGTSRLSVEEPERPRVVTYRTPTEIPGTGGQAEEHEPAPAPPPPAPKPVQHKYSFDPSARAVDGYELFDGRHVTIAEAARMKATKAAYTGSGGGSALSPAELAERVRQHQGRPNVSPFPGATATSPPTTFRGPRR